MERADKHISDLKVVLDILPECYTVEIETNPETGKPSIKRSMKDWRRNKQQIALITGDAIHNLRTALDYAWIGVLEKLLPSVVDEYSKFPIRRTRQEVENTLKGRKIDTACPALYKRVVSEIKPYIGGDDSLYGLHDLDISDKHLDLIPAITPSVLVGITFKNEETGERITGNTWVTTHPGPYYVDMPEGTWNIENKGQHSFSVVFGQVEILHDLEILDTLQFLSKLILQVVKLLEQT